MSQKEYFQSQSISQSVDAKLTVKWKCMGLVSHLLPEQLEEKEKKNVVVLSKNS